MSTILPFPGTGGSIAMAHVNLRNAVAALMRAALEARDLEEVERAQVLMRVLVEQDHETVLLEGGR